MKSLLKCHGSQIIIVELLQIRDVICLAVQPPTIILPIKACVNCHNGMGMSNYMQKGTPTAKIFKNESVLLGWYQSWIPQMIAKGILKFSSETIPHDVT